MSLSTFSSGDIQCTKALPADWIEYETSYMYCLRPHAKSLITKQIAFGILNQSLDA